MGTFPRCPTAGGSGLPNNLRRQARTGSGRSFTLIFWAWGRPGFASPLLTLLWNVDQRTRVIGVCCRVEDLDAGVVVAGKCRCVTRTACLHGIVRRIEPNPEVINLHGAISYRARL